LRRRAQRLKKLPATGSGPGDYKPIPVENLPPAIEWRFVPWTGTSVACP
jgi:hypothetical protein